MGWTSDKPGHEGYPVGLTEEASAGNGWVWWRELAMRPGDETPRQVERFQVGCVCGWRSRVFWAPASARWFPYAVALGDEVVEDAARALWQRHIDDPSPRGLVPAPEGT